MSSIFECLCARCRRIISVDALTIYEGRDYHDNCFLQLTRSRISELDRKIQRGTATILDAKELGEQIEIERSVKKDMENPGMDFGKPPSPPVFFGNTPLGMHSIRNPPAWKRLPGFEGGKFHMHKKEQVLKTTEPIFEIFTREDGHKYCLQVGTKQIDNITPSLPLEKEATNSKIQTNAEGEASLRGLPQKIGECEDLKSDKTRTS